MTVVTAALLGLGAFVGWKVQGMDPLAPLRVLGAEESLTMEEGQLWRQIQFSQPCSSIRPQLDQWQEELLRRHPDSQLTDLEDREMGPLSWARGGAFVMRAPMHLDEERNCGFEVMVKARTSWQNLKFWD